MVAQGHCMFLRLTVTLETRYGPKGLLGLIQHISQKNTNDRYIVIIITYCKHRQKGENPRIPTRVSYFSGVPGRKYT